MGLIPNELGAQADLALAVHLRSLAVGKRVLWIGPLEPGARLFLENIAASEMVWVAPRIKDAWEHTEIDLIVAPDVTRAGLTNAGEIEAARGLLASSGCLVACSPAKTDTSIGYEDLFDLVAPHFPAVRMFGQAPFSGSAMADFAEHADATVAVDSSLLASAPEDPIRFVAVAAATDAAIEAYSVVQVRAKALSTTGNHPVVEDFSPADALPVAQEIRELEEKLAERAAEVVTLRAELEQHRLAVRDLIEQLRHVPTASSAPESISEAEALERTLEAEARVAERQYALDETELRLHEANKAHAALETARAELSGRVRGYLSRVAELEELRAHAEAQLSLARLDGETSVARQRVAEQQLVELQKHFELELVRTRSSPPPGLAGEARAQSTEAELDGLRGERNGLRAALADRVSALEALETRAREAGEHVPRVDLERAEEEIEQLEQTLARLRAQESALTERVSEAHDRAAYQENQVSDLLSTVASRDALIAQLRGELDAVQRAERASTEELEATRRARRVLEERVSQLAAGHAKSRELLEDVRSRFATIDRAFLQEDGAVPTGITSVGMESPVLDEFRPREDDTVERLRERAQQAASEVDVLRGRLGYLGREAEEREKLLHTLTLQFEERDDQVRTLQAARAGGAETGGPLQREILALQERVARLSDQLLREREARRAAESSSGMLAPADGIESEVKRLEDLLNEREAEVLLMRGKISNVERDVRSMRETVAQARAGIEILLTSSTSRGDPSTAERLGSILRLLGRS